MKRIITGLAASAAMLAIAAGAQASTRIDNSDLGATSSDAGVKTAQASGSSGNSGSTANQQFLDPKVRSVPGTNDEPTTTGSTTSGSGANDPADASQSKRKNDEDPATQSGSK